MHLSEMPAYRLNAFFFNDAVTAAMESQDFAGDTRRPAKTTKPLSDLPGIADVRDNNRGTLYGFVVAGQDIVGQGLVAKVVA